MNTVIFGNSFIRGQVEATEEQKKPLPDDVAALLSATEPVEPIEPPDASNVQRIDGNNNTQISDITTIRQVITGNGNTQISGGRILAMSGT